MCQKKGVFKFFVLTDCYGNALVTTYMPIHENQCSPALNESIRSPLITSYLRYFVNFRYPVIQIFTGILLLYG